MNKKQLSAILLLVLVFGLPLVIASAEYTQTIVHFNVPSEIAYTLTLPGVAAVNSAASPAATADIDFNCSSSGSVGSVNASAFGGSTQSNGTPIFQFDNTGNLNLNITVYLNDTVPSCIKLWGNNTWALPADIAASDNAIAATNVTVALNLAPADPAVNWYMWANFSGCTPDEDVDRILFSSGFT